MLTAHPRPEQREDRPLELLEREITQLAAHIHAATCRWLALVAEFDRREGWASWGCKSCAHWLAYTCALGSVAAREHVRVARRLEELPAIQAAFGRGELSYSQVRAMSRVATPELEERLLELARHATASQLERVLRAYRGVVARELTAEDFANGDRYLVCDHDTDGSVLIRGRLPAEEGELVMSALACARDSLRDAGVPAGRRDAGVAAGGSSPSNADAIVLMSETLLGSALSSEGNDGYQVIVHVDAASLAGSDDGEPGACNLEHGQLLHPETARRLACDTSVVRILERDGRPLSVGRKTRSVPPALRRALRARDRTCRFPGCDQRRFLHAHHVEHWARGGRTELANLVQLCWHHHRLVHEGGYTLERGQAEALIFRRPDGRPIPSVTSAVAGRSVELVADSRGRGAWITPDTCRSRWDGSRLDLALSVDGLVQMDSRLPDD
jgi:Domain of unknown function (DUF222)/HNH endonuclease